MTMEVTREAIEEGKQTLSTRSQRLIDLYKLHDIQFSCDDAVQIVVNKLAKCNRKKLIWNYLKILKKWDE